MMIVQGLLVGLVYYVCDLLSLAWCANPMVNRPIVLGPLVGLVLGDLQQGILIGASVELVFWVLPVSGQRCRPMPRWVGRSLRRLSS